MTRPPASGRWLGWTWLLVPAALAVVFLTLAVLSRAAHDDNEQRLLEQQTNQGAAVLAVAIEQVRTPLDGVLRASAAMDGDADTFTRVAVPLLGPGSVYERMALFASDSTEAIATVGDGDLRLGHDSPIDVDLLLTRTRSEPFVVVDLLADNRTLGYAVADGEFVVYAERTLSADPNVRRRSDEPFAGVDYAIYLGTAERDDQLLGSSVRDLPIDGRRATATSPFGGGELLLVMTPTGALGDPLLGNLWWIIIVGGGLVTVGAGMLLGRLNHSRERALELAEENDRLFRRQRDIAETLQLALLPQRLDGPPGSEVAARYWPAGAANLIGGDLYDVFRSDDQRWIIAIGDVCGQGITAAALSAQIRHTVRGVSRRTTSPARILDAVHEVVRDHEPPTFCTACVAAFTPDGTGGGTLELALGGHPQALLRRADGRVEAIGAPGTLLGLVEPSLTDVSVAVAAGDTLVLYTDGLTDAPGDQSVPIEEVIDVMAAGGTLPAGELADAIRALKRRRRPEGSSDDTALVVVRFGVTPV